MQRQLAIKVLIIFVLGVVALIPVSMVKSKVYERQGFQEQARSSVTASWTGPQLILTPVLVIPYQLSAVATSGFQIDQQPLRSDGLHAVLPETLRGEVHVENKSVFKGIYEVPVYNSDATFTGKLSSTKIKQQIAKIKRLPRFESLGVPYFSIHIADVRGISKTPSLKINQKPVRLNPGSRLEYLDGGLHAEFPLISGQINDLTFTLDLSLRGMGSLSLIQLADDAKSVMSSDWPHPEFIGASLPVEREITPAGFDASWSTTRYSSNSAVSLEQCLEKSDCNTLLASAFGVNFIEPVDIYLQSERSVKYALLFIGLSFITFFIFENIKKIPIHPIQYAFVGLAISVFYLLLISLAEHIAFHWAYTFAVMCCCGLLLFYVRYMLKNILSAILFSAMILGLYGLLYVIVQAEDFALLMGSFLVFAVLAILMYVTRKIDWYDLAKIEGL
jgi:inner membrane protein